MNTTRTQSQTLPVGATQSPERTVIRRPAGSCKAATAGNVGDRLHAGLQGEPSAAFDFTGLTPAQQRILSHQGWCIGMLFPQPGPSTVRKLLARGLVVAQPRAVGGFPPITVQEYVVPIPVHIAWCMRCSAMTGGAA